MAHFRAVVRGGRGSASRLGHKSTGISTLLQTWGWDVKVDALHMESAGANGEDWAEVELINHMTGEKKLVARLNLTTGELRGGSLSSGPARTPTLGPCSCRPGVARDNCPACEGTGQRIDFAAIRARNVTR